MDFVLSLPRSFTTTQLAKTVMVFVLLFYGRLDDGLSHAGNEMHSVAVHIRYLMLSVLRIVTSVFLRRVSPFVSINCTDV